MFLWWGWSLPPYFCLYLTIWTTQIPELQHSKYCRKLLIISSWYRTAGSPCIYPVSVTDVTQSQPFLFSPNIPAGKGPTEAEGVKIVCLLTRIFSLLLRIPSWPPPCLFKPTSTHTYLLLSWVSLVPNTWELVSVPQYFSCGTVKTGRGFPLSNIYPFIMRFF